MMQSPDPYTNTDFSNKQSVKSQSSSAASPLPERSPKPDRVVMIVRKEYIKGTNPNGNVSSVERVVMDNPTYDSKT
jgi:hypothetical protein